MMGESYNGHCSMDFGTGGEVLPGSCWVCTTKWISGPISWSTISSKKTNYISTSVCTFITISL